MRALSGDTIAAVATPSGKGGIGIIRVSGPAANLLLQQLIGKTITPRQAHFTQFFDSDQQVIDEGIALWFQHPASFTGEDMFELHAHGSPVVLDLILQTLTQAGARLAEPGEFSRRAFENNKYDLSQLEAVADLINSTSVQAARSAQRVLQGEFSKRVHTLVEALVRLRVLVEAAIDFADEDIEIATTGAWQSQLQAINTDLTQLKRAAAEGARLHAGAAIAIVGGPNAGKSSLLNQLAQYDAAIVSDIAGTTRDVLKIALSCHGAALSVMDTAGLRDDVSSVQDPIEQEGMRRAREAMYTADLVLIVIDATVGCRQQERDLAQDLVANEIAYWWVFNKIDLISTAQCAGIAAEFSQDNAPAPVLVSAKTAAGINQLGQRLATELGLTDSCEDALIARRRHLAALDEAEVKLKGAEKVIGETELLAEELRLAQTALATITGEETTEDLLGKIFATFCIGK